MQDGRTLTTPPRGRKDPSRATRLLVAAASELSSVGQSIVLTKHAAVTVGRAEESGRHLCLPDPEASRIHVKVEWRDDRWVLTDLDSRNGTFVDGERVTEAPLAAPSVVRVGSTVLIAQEVTPQEALRLLEPPSERSALVGESTAMLAVRAAVQRFAPLSLPVLIVGESGVGKEVVARELHRATGRTGPLITVNCAALPEQLAESELFGHVKGAFTGADRASRGLFGEADGGSIFLDEIGEMAPPLQAKLLRTLATGEVRPVGDSNTWAPDVRVIAATNVELDDAIEAGGFRGDLYARMMGARIAIPPLRERRADILPLARVFLARAGGHREITADAAEALLLDPWRFNVRELEQIIEVAGGSSEPPLDLDALPTRFAARIEARTPAGPDPDAASLERDLRLLEIPRDAIPDEDTLARVLSHYRGNITHTARFFGRSRRQVHRWAERYGIDVTELQS